MDFEERERQRKRQFIKVAIAELGMVLSVVAIVVVATLASMGFFVSSDGSIEQSGVMQIRSMPTGATVTLDGSTLFSHTNLSRTMAAGAHQIKLSKDGYDTWEKTISMTSGILIRLYYPRLFLLNRTPETVNNLAQSLAFYSVSSDYNNILYAATGKMEWILVNVRNDEVKTTKLDVSAVLAQPTTDTTGAVVGVAPTTFDGTVEIMEWSESGEQVLTKVTRAGETEWILVNLKDLANSLNLTREFKMKFSQVEMANGSAGQLFALEGQRLRRVNVADKSISNTLLSDVLSFASAEANVAYVTMSQVIKEGEVQKKRIGVYRDGEKGGTLVTEVLASQQVLVELSKYSGDYYLSYVVDDVMTVLYGSLPSYSETDTELTSLKYLFEPTPLPEVPTSLSVGPDGEQVLARREATLMVADFEMMDVASYKMAAGARWLVDGMLSAVVDQELWVWDYDGENLRVLVGQKNTEDGAEDNVDSENDATSVVLANYPAAIASNNRWLYYVVQTPTGYELVREKIRD